MRESFNPSKLGFDPYQVIGVSKDATASEIQANSARLLEELRTASDPVNLTAMRQVSQAKSILLNPTSRAALDTYNAEFLPRVVRFEPTHPSDPPVEGHTGPKQGRNESWGDYAQRTGKSGQRPFEL